MFVGEKGRKTQLGPEGSSKSLHKIVLSKFSCWMVDVSNSHLQHLVFGRNVALLLYLKEAKEFVNV